MSLTANKMTESAIQNDEALSKKLTLIGVTKIFIDRMFNCRQQFGPMDCRELAEDIARRGLEQPVIVRELRPESKFDMESEYNLLNKGFTHYMIAGHRRLIAYKINNAEVIPCFVKDAYTSDFDCKDINAIENIQRMDLNLYEECMTIRHYFLASWTRQEVADRVGKSVGWVHLRYQLLNMDERIIDLAKTGLLTTQDVKELGKYRNPVQQLQVAGKIRDLRKKEGKRGILAKSLKKADKPTVKKHRGRQDIFEMQELIRKICKKINRDEFTDNEQLYTVEGNSLMTRLLGWCAGDVNSFEMHRSIQRFCELYKIEYEMPEFDDSLF